MNHSFDLTSEEENAGVAVLVLLGLAFGGWGLIEKFGTVLNGML